MNLKKKKLSLDNDIGYLRFYLHSKIGILNQNQTQPFFQRAFEYFQMVNLILSQVLKKPNPHQIRKISIIFEKG